MLVNLKIAREARGYKQKDFAKLLGVSQQRYSTYELGKRQPDFSMLLQIAELLNITTDYLFGLTSETSDEINLPSEKEQQEKLSIAEKLLVDNYRKSSDEGKKAILGEAQFAALNSSENS
ncbi:MAG: helix-turn-helix domain-containing protein [Defluviitaleaceae bacterium]|nr:helix-turn-helix domain-containing protein [Defluviitaleaceae bacterium]